MMMIIAIFIIRMTIVDGANESNMIILITKIIDSTDMSILTFSIESNGSFITLLSKGK